MYTVVISRSTSTSLHCPAPPELHVGCGWKRGNEGTSELVFHVIAGASPTVACQDCFLDARLRLWKKFLSCRGLHFSASSSLGIDCDPAPPPRSPSRHLPHLSLRRPHPSALDSNPALQILEGCCQGPPPTRKHVGKLFEAGSSHPPEPPSPKPPSNPTTTTFSPNPLLWGHSLPPDTSPSPERIRPLGAQEIWEQKAGPIRTLSAAETVGGTAEERQWCPVLQDPRFERRWQDRSGGRGPQRRRRGADSGRLGSSR